MKILRISVVRLFIVILPILLLTYPVYGQGDPLDAIVGYWKLNGDAVDSSSNGLDGQIMNTVSFVNGPFGDSNGAMQFLPSPVQGAVWVDHNPVFDTVGTTYAVSFWAITNSMAQSVFACKQIRTGGDDAGFRAVMLAPTYKVSFGTRDLSTFLSNQAIPLQQWTNVILVQDGNQFSTYIDGQLDNSITFSNPAGFSAGSHKLQIGACAPQPNSGSDLLFDAYNFAGALSDFAVFDRPLTAQEISDYYSSGQRWIPEQDCFIDAPVSVNENESFTASVTCNEQEDDVYGFEFAHSIDPTSPALFPQSTTYGVGSIFNGKNSYTLINTLVDGYAQTLLSPELPTTIVGSETLGSVTYDTDLPGTVTFNLDTLILGNELAEQINATLTMQTMVEIIDLPIAAVSGTATRETGLDTGSDITLTIDTITPISTTVANGVYDFEYDETVALDGLLEVDAPGHLYCSQTLALTDEVLNDIGLTTLLAGDVNDDGAINIADGAIIVSARIGDAVDPTYIPDLNEDDVINILDLIHVGRNFGTIQPNLCLSNS